MWKRIRSQMKAFKASSQIVAKLSIGQCETSRNPISYTIPLKAVDDAEVAQLQELRQRMERMADRDREPWFEVYKRQSGAGASRRVMIVRKKKVQPLQRPLDDEGEIERVAREDPNQTKSTFNFPPDVSPIEMWRLQHRRQEQKKERQRQEQLRLKISQRQPVSVQVPLPEATPKATPPTSDTLEPRPTAHRQLCTHPLQRARMVSVMAKMRQHRYRQRKLLLEEHSR